jgi:hypothetical protein
VADPTLIDMSLEKERLATTVRPDTIKKKNLLLVPIGGRPCDTGWPSGPDPEANPQSAQQNNAAGKRPDVCSEDLLDPGHDLIEPIQPEAREDQFAA